MFCHDFTSSLDRSMLKQFNHEDDLLNYRVLSVIVIMMICVQRHVYM